MTLWWVALCAAGAAEPPVVEDDARMLWRAEGGGGDSFGWAVSALGDVDGDGAPEVLTSAPFGAGGAAVVLSGRTGAIVHWLSGASGDQNGFAIADAGDVDGDGVHDVLSGAPGGGVTYVYSGASGAVVWTLVADDGGDAFGAAVAGPGDLTGDGVADVIVGADLGGAVGGGYVRAFSGATGEALWTYDADRAGDHVGVGTGPIDDVDGDGVPDVVVGAKDGGDDLGGRVLVLSGADGLPIRGPLAGSTPGVDLGYFFVAGVPDMNGDGVADIFGGDFSSAVAGTQSGAAFVWSGADGAELWAAAGAAAGEGLGCGRGGGDLDGDGVPDLAIGAWTSSLVAAGAGRVEVYSGATGALVRTLSSVTAGENFGFDAVGVGDLDGDGGDDLAVGAATMSRVYAFAGTPAPDLPDDTGPVGDTDTDTPADTGPVGDTAAEPDTGSDDTGAKGGCGCAGGASPAGAGVLGALLLALRRRRSR